jgi:hypothetical protein
MLGKYTRIASQKKHRRSSCVYDVDALVRPHFNVLRDIRAILDDCEKDGCKTQLCVLHGAKREAARQAFAVLQIVRRRLVDGLQRLARRRRLLAGVLGAFIVRQGSARGAQIAPPL